MKTLRNQSEVFSNLHGLCSPFGAEFIKQAAGVGFHRVLAYKKLGGDLAIA